MDTTLSKYGYLQTGLAQQFQSDRIFNPNKMMCLNNPLADPYGRSSNADTLYTEMEGCSSPSKRIIVENNIRPKSFGSLNLNSVGVEGTTCATQRPSRSAQIGTNSQKTDEDIVEYNTRTRYEQWVNINARVLYYKRLSGCL